MVSDIEDADIMNIASVYRFSGSNLIQPESLSDHIAECLGLTCILYSKFHAFNFEKVIYYCAIHDFGECYTGDIVRPVKYSSEEMKKMMDKLEYELLNENLCTFIADECLKAKHHKNIESALAYFIDVLQAAYKIYREYKLQNLNKFLMSLKYSVSVLNDKCLPNLATYCCGTDELKELLYSYCFELVSNLRNFAETEDKKGSL